MAGQFQFNNMNEQERLSLEERSKIMASLTKEEIDLRKVFIDHVPCDVTVEDVEYEFSKHGPLLEAAKYQDRKDPNRHYAFVTYKYPQDCAKATNNPEPVLLIFLFFFFCLLFKTFAFFLHKT